MTTWVILPMVIFLSFTVGYAQDVTVTDDEVNAIAKRLYCPVCENIPLDACGTAACIEWREEIRTQLEDGRSEQAIINDFVDRYGERVVGTPQNPLLRALAVVTPWLLAMAVLGAAVVTFVRWQRRSHTATPTNGSPVDAPPQGDYRAQLERDLRGEG